MGNRETVLDWDSNYQSWVALRHQIEQHLQLAWLDDKKKIRDNKGEVDSRPTFCLAEKELLIAFDIQIPKLGPVIMRHESDKEEI